MKIILLPSLTFLIFVAATAMSQPLNTILTNGLVAYYPFMGNANDATHDGNNGMVSGATLTTDRFGNQNSAYSFDGISDVITIPDFAGADANGHTISAWVKANTPPWVTILGKDGVGERQWVCQWYQTGQNAASIRWAVFTSTGEYDLDSNAQLQTNQWYQISTVWDGANQSQFINGVFDSSMSAPGTLAQHTQPVRIGGCPGEGFFDGIIGDVRIYDRALSSQEVAELFSFEQQQFIFQSAAQTNQTVALTWNTSAGFIYQLQYSTNLSQSSWNNLGYPLEATNGVISIPTEITTDAARFYRVILSQ